MKLYHELAEWWPQLSPPSEYEEEAQAYAELIGDVKTLLELGSGGGHNASHLKKKYDMTLVDLSERMLEMSKRLNPELLHLQGDMRTVRVGKTFDVVFVHDAISYMQTLSDLKKVMETAFLHAERRAVFCPDDVKDTFEEVQSCGGSGDIRYLEWTWRLSESMIRADYAYLLRGGDDVDVVHDHMIGGLFSIDEWLETMRSVGFEPRAVTLEEIDESGADMTAFVGEK